MPYLTPVLLSALLACTSGDAEDTGTTPSTSTSTSGSGLGTLALRFSMDPDYIEIMDEEPSGPFWGSIFDSDQVSGVGPEDGAEVLGTIEVESFSLDPAGGSTEVLFQTEALPNIKVVILGFLDSDGNADITDPDPDDGDPVTLPGDNRFTVVSDVETEIDVYFGFLNP